MAYPTITPLPDAPQRTQSPDAFATTADTFVAALPDLVTDVNAAGDYIENKTILVGNDFQGVYAAGTTYSIGQSVSYSSSYYVSLVDSNLGNTPDSSPSEWQEVNIEAVVSLDNLLYRDVTLTGASQTLDADNYDIFYSSHTDAITYGVTFTGTNKEITVFSDAGTDYTNGTYEGAYYTGFTALDYYGFTLDGLQVLGVNDSYIYSWTLDEPWVISSALTTANYTSRVSLTLGTNTKRCLYIPEAKDYVFVVDQTAAIIKRYTVNTPGDFSTLTNTGRQDEDLGAFSIYGLWFSDDGLTMLVLDNTNDQVNSYALSTAWDPSSRGAVTSLSTTSLPRAFGVTPDGKTILTIDATTDEVTSYPLTTAYDISTVGSSSVTTSGIFTYALGTLYPKSSREFYGGGTTSFDRLVFDLNPVTFPSGFNLSETTSGAANTSNGYKFLTTDGGTTWRQTNSTARLTL